MKTTGFGSLEVGVLKGGGILVTLFEPTQGSSNLPMSADELMIFLVEAGNILASARREETKGKQDLELQREMNR